MLQTKLVVRLMLASKDGEREVAPILEAVRQFAPSVELKSSPYWKIPEYEECSLRAVVQGDGERELERLMNLIGLGWTVGGHQGEKAAVWRGEGTPTFPSVRWVNIETFPMRA